MEQPIIISASSEGSGRDASPSEVPEPESRCQEETSPTSPIAVGSSDEADNCSRDNDTEPSEEEPQVVTITSMSEGDESLGGAPDEAPESRADTEAARGTRLGVQPDGDEAEETESGTTDEVIDIEVCEEKTLVLCPRQVMTSVSLTLDPSMYHSPTQSPLCIVDCAQLCSTKLRSSQSFLGILITVSRRQ